MARETGAPRTHFRLPAQQGGGTEWRDAHLKRQVMGREVVVAITNGKLDFGPWEQIFYGEFDGGRRKRVGSGDRPCFSRNQSINLRAILILPGKAGK